MMPKWRRSVVSSLAAIAMTGAARVGVAQFQPTAPLTASDSAVTTAIGREIAHVSTPCGNRRCSYSDAAIYEALAGWRLGYIAMTVSGCFRDCPEPILDLDTNHRPYWLIDTTQESFVVNDLVSKIGSATGWSSALVQRTCVNVSPAQGVTAYCQMFANYGADDGDSGAPILLDIGLQADSTVTLGGIHSGRAGSNSVFSPWSGIVQDYGTLSVIAPQRPRVPAVAPDTVPQSVYDEANIERGSAQIAGAFVRNVVLVLFRPGATQPERQEAIDLINGEVVGGRRLNATDGLYYVRIATDGTTTPLLEAIAALKGLPQVELAIPELIGALRNRYLLPHDGTDWQSWRLLVDSADGANWAPEGVAAPLAWGCRSGDAAAPIAVVDNGFHNTLQLTLNVTMSSPYGQLPADSHGTGVATVLAARGNDSVGMTGIMWRAGLRLYEAALDPTNPTAPPVVNPLTGEAAPPLGLIMRNVVQAGLDGARAINLSMGICWPCLMGAGYVPHTPADTNLSNVVAQATAATLRALDQHGLRPLFVVAAGNDGLDAYWSGIPRVRDTFPDRVLAVGATVRPTQLASFSNRGSLVDVVAPGEAVRMLGRTGNIYADDGTSFAAPIVTGIAGLLVSFDSTLTGPDLRTLIVEGAGRGGRTAAGIPTANAYEALRLAAQRSGAPLCGNRVWVNSNAVTAERDPVNHTTEQLVALGEPGRSLNVRHGGRRFEVSADTGIRSFELRQGTWVETGDAATTPSGGTFLSMFARSHDLDSAAIVEWTASNDSEVVVRLDIRDFGAGTLTPLRTLVFPTARYPTSACVTLYDGACGATAPTGTDEDVERIELAYPSFGGRLLLAVTYFTKRDVGFTPWEPCDPNPPYWNSCSFRAVNYEGQTDRTVLWAVDLQTGADTSLWALPGVAVFWFSVSEEGAERVSGEGVTTAAGTGTTGEVFLTGVTGCAVRYRSMASGAEVRPAVLTADACETLRRGQGTMAPAPPIVLSP